MNNDAWVSLVMSIPVGILSGLYAGLIVARYQRFSDLRSKVLRIIREIDFVDEIERIAFPKRTELVELTLVASDFFFLKHERAGDETLRLQSEISESLRLGSQGELDYATFDRRYSDWQKRGRRLSPNLFWILRLWGGL